MEDDFESKICKSHGSLEISESIGNRTFVQTFITTHLTDSCNRHKPASGSPHGEINFFFEHCMSEE